MNTPLSRLCGTSPLNRGDNLVAHPFPNNGTSVGRRGWEQEISRKGAKLRTLAKKSFDI